MNPRQLAAKALNKVTSEGAYSNLVLSALLKENELSNDDKALATAIFYGTLDRLVTVDFYLKKLIKTPLKKLKPYTLAVLRTATYQIKYMSKIPDSAAVNEAVKLIKASKEGFNASFVNAVLRNLLRSELPLPSGNSLYDISVGCSCPQWIVSILIRDYGTDFTRGFLENALLSPPIFIRVNTQKISADGLLKLFAEKAVSAEKISDTALLIKPNGSLEETDEYKNGLFFVQDLSCQKAIELLGVTDTSSVLDLCAAPGGKSFNAAIRAENGRVVACDLYEQRAGLIEKGAERLGLKNLTAKAGDAAVYDETLGLFDRIICDVPCSGLGVIRRKPDIKYKPQGSFEELTKIQRDILFCADKYLSVGGKLLYSTCTLNRQENRENVDAFLKVHQNYTLLAEETFSPDKDNTDGFYAAVLQKG